MNANIHTDIMKNSETIFEAAERILTTASRLIRANTFCVASNDTIFSHVFKSFNRDVSIIDEGAVLPYNEAYCHLVIEKKKGILHIEDNFLHPYTKDMNVTQAIGSLSFVGVPIVNKEGQVFGTLCAFDHNHYPFSSEDLELLGSLAVYFSYAVDMDNQIVQLQKAEAEASRTLQEKANLLAFMGHEIRNPMNGIMGMAALLNDTELNEEQSEYTKLLLKSGDSLLSVMNDLLNYSRIDASEMELDLIELNIRVELNELMQLFAKEAQRKGIHLNCTVAPDMPDVLTADVNKLRQILTNLLGNAVKFTENGEIRVSVSWQRNENENQLLISVSDTGIGIPPSAMPRLFEPFAQFHSQADYGGTGLGLAICKRLVERMSGSIQLQEKVGPGTEFTFSIRVHVPVLA
ncbi:hypothetical protein SY83_10160 [Paenibacillus swuensis]|uniref:Circadian input-output histidine kinase CikA n=1 Tax=Paenibacillus swuensis TaxID=1178515 RepID=A0A172TI87_9BACL|nr:GAF domain-containing protein [Paenibacillus swuensis]ANE46577.1 hypothetical protein SY83_10160 [Paenibacillus swuensis]